jgi:hypothetical protein
MGQARKPEAGGATHRMMPPEIKQPRYGNCRIGGGKVISVRVISEVPMSSVNYKPVACYLRPDQHQDLKRLSAETLIPFQRLLRQAVDKILVDYKIRPKSRAASINARLAKLRTKGARN